MFFQNLLPTWQKEKIIYNWRKESPFHHFVTPANENCCIRTKGIFFEEKESIGNIPALVSGTPPRYEYDIDKWNKYTPSHI